jgi:hypothetical protein
LTASKSLAALLLGASVLLAAAALRSFEYDEAYSVFVTSGKPRPAWPRGEFRAGEVRAAFTGHSRPAAVARALRATDVHPPLYFWALAAWRRIAGDGIFALRLLSVGCAVAALGLVWAIARDVEVTPHWAMALTACSYGFAYTGAIARGFAMAEALALGGVLLVLKADTRGRALLALLAGLLFGAAGFTNYLAVFVGGAALLWLAATNHRRARLWLGAVAGFALFVPPDLWFFLAQRESRTGQFPRFQLGSGLVRLARDAGASLIGGLPLYVEGTARLAVEGLSAVVLALLAIEIIARWPQIGRRGARSLIAMTAIAPGAGLLLLGAIFDTTPIELRYLCFAVPFVALLLSGALVQSADLRGVADAHTTAASRITRHLLGPALLSLEGLAILGLLTRPETMQPARAAARAAAALAGPDGLVLLPRGNDGVGVVGPFVAEAPDWLRLKLISASEAAAQLQADAGAVPVAVLATIEPDAASHAAVSSARASFASPCWREIARRYDAIAYARECPEAATRSLAQ